MEQILQAFITLFVIMDPLGNIPLFMGMTKGMPLKDIRINFNRSVLVAGLLLFAFLFFGHNVLNIFNINIDSFRIAGGIVLLIIGVIYVLGLSHKILKTQGSNLVVPIGTPLLTGPGVITTTILLAKEYGVQKASIAAGLTLILTWIILMNAVKLYKMLGEHW
ncbi:MAG: MarC family protein, partial [Nanoarchaeota archaeon]